MAFLSIDNVIIKGIVSCVPRTIQSVKDSGCLLPDDAEKLTETTGIFERRIAAEATCTSDLCLAAAEKLISDLGWSREEIDALVFVTQTPDFQLPATSPILQNRLKLGPQCLTLDISLGCSGYIYGLATLSKLMAGGGIRKGLLLVGDTISKICSPNDKSTYPLFGDAGTATALVYDPQAKNSMAATLMSNGGGYKAIMVKEGASRFPINSETTLVKNVSEGISRHAAQLILEGMDVFSFGITKAPEVVKQLFSELQLTDNEVDYYVFHQANLMMNEKIRKKLGIAPEKVPYSLSHYGNTSSATIPLTIATQLKERMTSQATSLVLCGFGVGLSWGALYLKTSPLEVVDQIEI